MRSHVRPVVPLLLLASVFVSTPTAAQTTFGAPQRAAARDAMPEKKGTGIVRGKVTSAENGRPLRRVQISITSPELSEARIEHEGRDLADVPIEVRHGQRLEGVTIVISQRLPTLTGALVDRNAQPIEGTVVLFPEDTARWGESSRRIRTARPDAAGGFEIRHLPPGDYLIAGVEYVRDGEWEDPEYLEKLKARAVKVTLTEGAAARVSVLLNKE